MRHVGDEVFAHLLQLMNARHVAHQHQMLIVAITGDQQLNAQAIVGRRRNFQRLAVVAQRKVFLEAWMSYQIGHGLPAVLRRLQTQQGFGGTVPPLRVAVAVEHDHGIA